MTPFKLPDRYKQTAESYEGGQGIVWIYEDTDLDRTVAVKFMKPSQDPGQLLEEITSLLAIRSKHVAQVYDLQFQNKTRCPALIQEYVPGPDLWEIAERGVSTEKTLRLLYQISCGIADIHQAGKIHRDIKPANIKSDAEGILKLLDFGLTCDALPQPSTQSARGTDAFRAPEMYNPPPVLLTPAIDTYAFGVTAWVLLSNGTMPDELRMTPPLLPAPSFATVDPTVRPEVVSVLDGTLSARPHARPAMAEVRQTLATDLLYGKHRAVLSQVGGVDQTILSKPLQAIRLLGVDGFVRIVYDGFSFRVQDVSREIFINNTPCRLDAILPESCVITIGTDPRTRVFYLFDMSHPEVVL